MDYFTKYICLTNFILLLGTPSAVIMNPQESADHSLKNPGLYDHIVYILNWVKHSYQVISSPSKTLVINGSFSSSSLTSSVLSVAVETLQMFDASPPATKLSDFDLFSLFACRKKN